MRLKFGISLFISSSPFYGKEFHKSKHEMGKIDATIQSRAPCPNYLALCTFCHLTLHQRNRFDKQSGENSTKLVAGWRGRARAKAGEWLNSEEGGAAKQVGK